MAGEYYMCLMLEEESRRQPSLGCLARDYLSFPEGRKRSSPHALLRDRLEHLRKAAFKREPRTNALHRQVVGGRIQSIKQGLAFTLNREKERERATYSMLRDGRDNPRLSSVYQLFTSLKQATGESKAQPITIQRLLAPNVLSNSCSLLA